MAGISEEQGREILAEVAELRRLAEASLTVMRMSLGREAGVTRNVEALRDRAGTLGAELQTLLGPQDRGPAEVLELPKRKKGGAHRA
jgi:hypothetical protein